MSKSTILAPEHVPLEYAGKWVAWTPNGQYPLAAGDTPEEARQAALAKGSNMAASWVPSMGVSYEWVPPVDELFIGSTAL